MNTEAMCLNMEIKTAKELGKPGTYKYGWRTCPDCKRQSWAVMRQGKIKNLRCHHCAGRVSSRLRISPRNCNGYLRIKLLPDDFFYPSTSKRGEIQVHRLIMAKHLGRNLHRWEIVHHKNGDKQDNRIENLELVASNGQHIRDHNKGYKDGYAKGFFDGRDEQIHELKTLIDEQTKQIKLLQWQITESLRQNNNVSIG